MATPWPGPASPHRRPRSAPPASVRQRVRSCPRGRPIFLPSLSFVQVFRSRYRNVKKTAALRRPILAKPPPRCGYHMALSQRLEFAAWLVERRLTAILDGAARAGTPERIMAAMRHAALGGGKRLRPFLVIETAALFDVTAETAVDAAAAIECVHCYSLVHDDLPDMDHDDLRSGGTWGHM